MKETTIQINKEHLWIILLSTHYNPDYVNGLQPELVVLQIRAIETLSD